MAPSDIIILTPDCLRAAERDLLTEIRERADLFVPNCYSGGTWTLPAHATLVSGDSPVNHGAIRRGDNLEPEKATIPKAARSTGYTTALVSENPTFGTGNGFGAGMDIVDEDIHLKRYPSTYSPAKDISDISLESAQQILTGILWSDAPVTNGVNTLNATIERFLPNKPTSFPHHGKRVLNHLSTHLNSNDRLFAIANVLDPHNPHYCPPPVETSDAEIDISKEEIRALASAADNRKYVFDQPLPEKVQKWNETWEAVQNRFHDVYRAQVRFADQLISSWIDSHTRRLANSLVVIVGDHGQLFGAEGMVGHHTSTHPHGIAVPAAVSFPDQWGGVNEPDGAVSMEGLADAILASISGDVADAKEFVERWVAIQPVTCVDGPTWNIDSLRDEYGDTPQLKSLEVRRVSIIEEGIQTVHSCQWGSSKVKTRQYSITPENRHPTDAEPSKLTDKMWTWLVNADMQRKSENVSERLEALGYK